MNSWGDYLPPVVTWETNSCSDLWQMIRILSKASEQGVSRSADDCLSHKLHRFYPHASTQGRVQCTTEREALDKFRSNKTLPISVRTHPFNPKAVVAMKFPIDCLELIPIERSRLAKLSAL